MKNLIKNKKGENILVTLLTPPFIYGIIVFIVFILFLKYGGTGIIKNITDTLKTIPTWAWIILGAIILFSLLKGRSRGRRK